MPRTGASGRDATAPSGEQYEILGGGYRAVVTQGGAGLRVLEQEGRRLVDGFGRSEMCTAARGQVLLPWPNRIEDGRYVFHGAEHVLALSEPARGNAIHGLTRWVAWDVTDRTEHSVTLCHRLMARPGYPWTLDLAVRYRVGPDGLTVTVTVSNRSAAPAPYAHGAHPYLTLGRGALDRWELLLPASVWLANDQRHLPVGRHDVTGGPYDFRTARRIGSVSLDNAFTGLARTSGGLAVVRLADPDSGRALVLWLDQGHPWVQLYTGDGLGARARSALAVEPMTSPPNAFRTGTDLVVLDPAGGPGDTFSGSWGLRSD